MVMGSNFTAVPLSRTPTIQLAVYSVDKDGRLKDYLGAATRLENWLVVPLHVIVAHKTVLLLSVYQKDGTVQAAHRVETDEFFDIEGDLTAIKLEEKTFSLLKLKKANVAVLDGPSQVSITSAGKEPEISFGLIEHDPKVFGGLLYRGSTRGGFSGAAYMVGRQIVGVHLGGGAGGNYGLSASYILAMLRKPEETAEWLNKVRRSKGPLRYQRSKHNPDEAVVFVNGKYHVVDLSYLEQDEEGDVGARTTMLRVGRPEEEVDIREQDKERVPEVNRSTTFPPHYVDAVDPIVGAINTITEELQSKNLELAEQCSATQAEEYLKRHAELMDQLSEKDQLLQAMINSLGERYRELQSMLTKIAKTDTGREVLVKENEKLKNELAHFKQLKTNVNVETSLVKVIPKSVRKAKAQDERATLLDQLKAQGYQLGQIIAALADKGMVVPVVAVPAINAGTTSASTSDPLLYNATPPLLRQSSSDSHLVI